MKSQAAPLNVQLGQFRTGTGRVFAGRDRGKYCREKARLDKADGENRPVVVHVPRKTYSINSSFFLAMFGPSIRHHGPEQFLELYTFTGWDAKRTVEDAIREARSRKSPFSEAT